MVTQDDRTWLVARGVEGLHTSLPAGATWAAPSAASGEGFGQMPDYRAWMEQHGVERLDRVPCEDFPYYRLRAHRADGVYALTVLQLQVGGPAFDIVLDRLAETMALGPTSPSWIGQPLPKRA